MKILILISLVQLVIVIAIAAKAYVFFDTDNNTVFRTEQPDSSLAVPKSQVRAATTPSTPQDTFTGEEIRKLIRTELTQFFASLPESQQRLVQAPTSGQEMAPNNDWKIKQQDISQTIDIHISDGVISASDMARLQQRIARLDPESRAAMLGKLTRALHTGELVGSL